MSGVRARNESAWLLPNDGTRTNHKLRQDMRRFADADEVDLLVVGLRCRRVDAAAAAGPRGLEGRRAGRRAVLGSGHRLGQRRGRLAPPVLDRAARHLRRRSGPARLEQFRPRRGRVDGALRRLHPALPPQRLRDLQPGRSRRGLAHRLRRPAAVLPDDRGGTAGRGGEVAVGRPARLSLPAAPGGRQRRGVPARCGQAGHHRQGRPGGDRQRPVRQPAALHLPRLLPAGLQGQRQGLAADHPHSRRARARRRGPRRLHGHPHRRRRAHRPRHRSALCARRSRPLPEGEDRRDRRVLDRDPEAAA